LASYLTSVVLEWSSDPLSDSTPTWTTVPNTEVMSLEWWAGIDREGNDPEPGGMVVVLKNVSRKWEPLFGSNLIDVQQRFRLTVNGVQEGVWYSQDFALAFPTGAEYSEVTVTCGDGFDVLALDALPVLDPPDAQSYADVIASFEPWGYWRLGEPEGTRAVAQVRTVRRGKGKRARKVKVRTRVQVTAAEATGVSGPGGVYVNTPQLRQPGLIVGDSDTCVKFSAASSEHVRVSLDQAVTFRRQVTAIVWAYPTARAGSEFRGMLCGPLDASLPAPVFLLDHDSSNDSIFGAVLEDGGVYTTCFGSASSLPEDTVTMAALVWDGQEIRVYANAVQVGAEPFGGVMETAAAGGTLRIGHDNFSGDYFEGYLDEPCIIERALTVSELLGVYTAGTARGFPEQTAGERIAAIADSPLWVETEIQTTGRDVQPAMMFGQDRLEEIAEAAHGEGPRTMFFFNGDGNPVYLGHEWKATAAVYNTVQATFTDDGTGIGYTDLVPTFDNETYNEIVASREGGPLITVENTTASGVRGRRARTEETDLTLTEDTEVESLATHVLRLYEDPTWRPPTLSVNGSKALAQILSLDIGHLIRVKKSGVTGNPIDRIVHIIGKRKAITADKQLLCTWNLGRGFDGNDTHWRAGIHGRSEATSTTKAA